MTDNDLISETDGGAGCLDLPGPRLQLQHAVLYALVLTYKAVLLAARIVLHVLARLVALRLPALTTFVRPSVSGGPDGGPMCWTTAEPGGDAGCAPEGLGTCHDLAVATMVRPLRFPILVVVERALAAGWTLRRTAVMGSG